jgi:hypothetical protein
MRKFAGIKFVSGGQTGADRAALDFAIANGWPHGGWCPAGRLAEDGVIDWHYQLKETKTAKYEERTELNVRDSDATVIFSVDSRLYGGSLLTLEMAKRHGKPYLHLQMRGGPKDPAGALKEFVQANNVRVLNVAGPRASQAPGIGKFVYDVLLGAFGSNKVKKRADDNSRTSPR